MSPKRPLSRQGKLRADCHCHRAHMGHSFGPDLKCENYTQPRLGPRDRCHVTWLSHQASSAPCPHARARPRRRRMDKAA